MMAREQDLDFHAVSHADRAAAHQHTFPGRRLGQEAPLPLAQIRCNHGGEGLSLPASTHCMLIGCAPSFSHMAAPPPSLGHQQELIHGQPGELAQQHGMSEEQRQLMQAHMSGLAGPQEEHSMHSEQQADCTGKVSSSIWELRWKSRRWKDQRGPASSMGAV